MRKTRVVTKDRSEDHIECKGVLKFFRHCVDRNKLGELLVMRGDISPSQLKQALELQKESKRPLGRVLIDCAMISRKQLALLLACQKAVRLAAAFALCFVSLSGTAKKARAGQIEDLPQQIKVVFNSGAVDTGVSAEKISYPALFGAEERRSTNLKPFTKWTGMFKRLNATINDPKYHALLVSMKAELSGYRSGSIATMAKEVNAMMNRKKYIVDSKNWGKSDYWATPIEFMARGGDCEDFAIAKYVALRALGVPEERLRVAIVQDLRKNIPHAILVVYSEQGPLILDNQIKDVKRADQITHYKPIFSINRQAWWLHTTPTGKETTVVASAE